MIEFHIIDSMIEFQWSRNDVLVSGISFDALMIKLKHTNRDWAKPFLQGE